MVRASKLLVGLLVVILAGQGSSAAVDLADTGPPPARRVIGAETVHVPPVVAPIIDPFRPPGQPWLAGNRGIEYDTDVGGVVRASAAGVVTFAGQVGGDLFVTIRHTADLRTTVGYVQASLVVVGDTVVQGQPIALAGPTMHFTARRNGEYIDPVLLFRTGRVVVRLVPGPA